MGRGNETQLQVTGHLNYIILCFKTKVYLFKLYHKITCDKGAGGNHYAISINIFSLYIYITKNLREHMESFNSTI